jgi:hypothetical protein
MPFKFTALMMLQFMHSFTKSATPVSYPESKDHVFHFSPMRATYPSLFKLLNVVILILREGKNFESPRYVIFSFIILQSLHLAILINTWPFYILHLY